MLLVAIAFVELLMPSGPASPNPLAITHVLFDLIKFIFKLHLLVAKLLVLNVFALILLNELLLKINAHMLNLKFHLLITRVLVLDVLALMLVNKFFFKINLDKLTLKLILPRSPRWLMPCWLPMPT